MTTTKKEPDSFERARKRLLRWAKRQPGVVTKVCRFPNDDVPKFLERLDEFERKSAKMKGIVA